MTYGFLSCATTGATPADSEVTASAAHISTECSFIGWSSLVRAAATVPAVLLRCLLLQLIPVPRCAVKQRPAGSDVRNGLGSLPRKAGVDRRRSPLEMHFP